MTNKSEWQEANRRLNEDGRRKLGDPPTAEEMLAYSRGELSDGEAERIRELLVAYPELARMYAAAVPEAPRPGDPDAVSEQVILAGWSALQPRLGSGSAAVSGRERDLRAAQRGRFVFRQYVPTTIAAAVALVFFGLYVQAESRARYHEREARRPIVLGGAQELEPGGMRGPGPTLLRLNNDGYLLKLRLFRQVRHPHYRIELRDADGTVIWANNSAQPDEDDAFQIAFRPEFLRAGRRYELHVLGVDGENATPVETYDVAAPAE
jgi:hypothetical protein